MATSLIDEMQLDASNPEISVSNLLRKALIVASRLGLSEVPDWINKELSGYADDDALPPYRVVFGAVKAKIGGRWVPLQFPTNKTKEMVSKKLIFGSVAEIELLSEREGSLAMDFAPEAQQLIANLFRINTVISCFIERTNLDRILDENRNQVLRWAIALDKAGVRGEKLSFTGKEIEKAHSMIFNVDKGTVNIGVAGGSNNQSNTSSGTNARINNGSSDNSVNYITYNSQDFSTLADEFARLRSALLLSANDAEHFTTIGAIASAEIAAKESDASAIKLALIGVKAGGKWALKTAKEIGVALAADAIKSAISAS